MTVVKNCRVYECLKNNKKGDCQLEEINIDSVAECFQFRGMRRP